MVRSLDPRKTCNRVPTTDILATTFPSFIIMPRLVKPFFVFLAFPSQTDFIEPVSFFTGLRAFLRLTVLLRFVTRLLRVTRLFRETRFLRDVRRRVVLLRRDTRRRAAIMEFAKKI